MGRRLSAKLRGFGGRPPYPASRQPTAQRVNNARVKSRANGRFKSAFLSSGRTGSTTRRGGIKHLRTLYSASRFLLTFRVALCAINTPIAGSRRAFLEGGVAYVCEPGTGSGLRRCNRQSMFKVAAAEIKISARGREKCMHAF